MFRHCCRGTILQSTLTPEITMSEIKTEKDLMKKLKALGELTNEQRNGIVCSLVGHSRIQEQCFGYYTCARCNEQLGDALGGVYPGAEKAVIVGHKCATCEKNYNETTWKDRIFCRDPFTEEKAA